jgi:hypothetical protein
MLEAEPLTGAARCKSILRRYDNGRLRQPAQGMRLCPGKPSNAASLSIEVGVVICGQVMSPAFEQSDDPIGWMRRYFSPIHNRTLARSRSNDPFRRVLARHHGQLDSLFVFKTNFGERLKNAVFIEGFDGFCHV